MTRSIKPNTEANIAVHLIKMAIKQSLENCLKQVSVLEREVNDNKLTAVSQTRLSALLGSARDALVEAERIVSFETPDVSKESLMKLRLW